MTPNKPSEAMVSLIQAMRAKRGVKPFALLLGSAAGPLGWDDFEKAVLGRERPDLAPRVPTTGPAERGRWFGDVWSGLDADSRFRDLKEALEQAQQAQTAWEDAYPALARLIERGHFGVVFTTQIHGLLEDALVQRKIPWNKWRTYTVRPDQRGGIDAIKDQLRAPEPRVKIVKLYGDMYDRSFGASAEDCRRYGKLVAPLLSEHLRESSTVIVGHTDRDTYLGKAVPQRLGHLYYVSPDRIPVGLDFAPNRTIDDESAPPEVFFPVLDENLREIEAIDEVTSKGVREEDVKEILESDAPLQTAIDKQRGLVVPAGDLEVKGVDMSMVEETEPPVLMRLEYDGHQVTFRLTGEYLRYSSPRGRPLSLDVEGLSRLAGDIGLEIARAAGRRESPAPWRARLKWEGGRLHKDLFSENPDLMQRFGAGREAAGSEERLQLCFAGPRDHLRLPYEFLCDEALPWLIRYPLYHEVNGIAGRTPDFAELVDRLVRDEEPLRVLLIASDTGGIAPDHEVDELQVIIPAKASRLGIRTEIDILRTEESFLEEVQRRLDHCRYHVVHFAGHGSHDDQQGEKSSLMLWGGRGRTGGRVELHAGALGALMRGGQTTLLVLSCCRGAQAGGTSMLYAGDALGLADAAVHAGVAAVLGYRWPVMDKSAETFAINFYEALLTSRDPAEAVLAARKGAYTTDSDDPTWASAVLVKQGS